MFAKLLKHEWRASRGTLGVLTLALLGVGLLAMVDLRVMINVVGNMESDNPFLMLLTIAMGAFLLMSFVALCGYGISVQFILLYRFYKNKYTDEGYLTFTLPVSVQQIFWASFVNMLIWLAISFVAIIGVVLMVMLFGTATEGLVNTEALKGLWAVIQEIIDLPWEEIFGADMAFTAVLYLLQILVAPFMGLITPMACITIGAVLAKKHKILAAFGVYYGISAVMGIVSSVVSMIPMVFMVAAGNEMAMMNVGLVSNLLLSIGLTVGGYFVSTYLMKRKLNLP